MEVETVRLLLERTFQMPVAESDAQIVLNRLQELGFAANGPTLHIPDAAPRCSACGCETYFWVCRIRGHDDTPLR
jgi:hypothetical protein